MIKNRSGWAKGQGRWALVVLAVTLALAPAWAWAQDTGKGNQISFRGGFAGLTSPRGGEAFTDTYGIGNPKQNATNGYYVGAALDLLLSRDLWGMMNGVSALGEIGVEFKRFNSREATSVVPTAVNNIVPGTDTARSKIQVTMLTVDVAPKLKFMEGSAFRPWVIPIGLDFHVISPPSNQTNYLDIGVQFGAGFEYQVWKEFKVGLDGRFHLASNQTNTVNNFGTIGPYIGIGF